MKITRFKIKQILFLLFSLTTIEATSYGGGEFKQHYDKGIGFYKQGKYEQAGAEFQKAIQLKPNDVYAIYGLGNTYYCLEKYDAAENAYLKAIEINPNYAKVHYSLSLVYSKTGKTQEAKEHKAIFRKISKGEKVSGKSGSHVKSSQTNRLKGVDYSKKKSLATAPKKSLATAPKKSLPEKKHEDTHRTHEADSLTHKAHEQSRHESVREEKSQQEQTVHESHITPVTRKSTKKDDSRSIFKGYSEETHKADKRVFTKKRKWALGNIIRNKWNSSVIHRIWLCTAGYIIATQIWLCIVSFLCVIVWRIRENA